MHSRVCCAGGRSRCDILLDWCRSRRCGVKTQTDGGVTSGGSVDTSGAAARHDVAAVLVGAVGVPVAAHNFGLGVVSEGPADGGMIVSGHGGGGGGGAGCEFAAYVSEKARRKENCVLSQTPVPIRTEAPMRTPRPRLSVDHHRHCGGT